MKKILILGSSGVLGNHLVNYLSKEFKIIHNGLENKIFDITKSHNLIKLLKKNADFVINCAAITNVDYCETHKKKTYTVNTLVSKNIFYFKKKYNLKFRYIFISTDQLYNNSFKSKEDSKIISVNYYTKSKILAEKIVLKNEEIVIRTNFFGVTKKNTFCDWIIDQFSKSSQFYLINDILFSPIGISTLVKAIRKIIKKFPLNGDIFNIGSSTAMSKEAFAVYLAKKMNIYNKNYKSINYSSLLNVKRSNNMSMNSNKFQKRFKFKIGNLKNQIDLELWNNKKLNTEQLSKKSKPPLTIKK
jgi:dTDP-4-dehydrorhamnose reductase